MGGGMRINKMKRMEIFQKEKATKVKKKAEKRQRQKELERDGGELGEAPERKKPRTLENTREEEPTMVGADDTEVFGDEADDEFAKYFVGLDGAAGESPKIMITTRPQPSKELFRFLNDVVAMVPNTYYYPRQNFDIKKICKFASNKKFTHLCVFAEKSKVCNGVIVSHLPHGPTAFFKVSSVEPAMDVKNHGQKTSHKPEIILNNFNTRLGRRVGRFLGSLFPHDPEFQGRQVVTFHNQRDYIFVRHHRYIFETADQPKGGKKGTTPSEIMKARLQELGPRFTLKLRWLQEGTFDTAFGEYEWIHRRKEMDISRRKFHL